MKEIFIYIYFIEVHFILLCDLKRTLLLIKHNNGLILGIVRKLVECNKNDGWEFYNLTGSEKCSYL